MAEVDDIINEPSESQQRIKSLSNKVKEEAEARAAAEAKAQSESEAKAQAERKVAFLEGFSDIVAENPAAKEFKADIEAKVLGGMSIEDAKFAVLGKAGKLNAPTVETPSPAGGSSNFTPPQNNGTKTPQEMSQAERREALSQALS